MWEAGVPGHCMPPAHARPAQNSHGRSLRGTIFLLHWPPGLGEIIQELGFWFLVFFFFNRWILETQP